MKHDIRNRDRRFWIIISKIWPEWKKLLYIVKPETVIRWERKRFRGYWWKKSRKTKKVGRPRIEQEHIEFIKRMSGDHPGWSGVRIRDELKLKFGIEHAPSTIDSYRVKGKHPVGGQTWRAFIKNHAEQIYACDFLTQHTISLRIYYIFVVMELSTRRIVHFNVTEHPTLQWVKRQIREAAGDRAPEFYIQDNDGIFGQYYGRSRRYVIKGAKKRRKSFRCALDYWLHTVMDIKGIPTPYNAPNANAYVERWHRTLREEALNHFIFFNETHIRKVVREYVEYYNHARPQQGIGEIPDPYPEILKPKPEKGRIRSLPVLGGIQHDYRMAA